jgi:hypothetical protein
VVRARLVAPLVAAVLGIACGSTAALVRPDPERGEGGGLHGSSDPLHLGIPLLDQACTGDSLLVIGYGDTAAPLSHAVVDSDQQGLHYLRSASSCDTVLGPERKPPPAYVVYRGPYASRSEPCQLRMSGEEPGSFVTVLRSGNQELVKCPCEVPSSEARRLFPGMEADAVDKLWIRSLQSMFHDEDAAGFPLAAITGDYDEPTSDRVAAFQRNAPGKQTTPGVVDETTWGILTDRLCRNYDY